MLVKRQRSLISGDFAMSVGVRARRIGAASLLLVGFVGASTIVAAAPPAAPGVPGNYGGGPTHGPAPSSPTTAGPVFRPILTDPDSSDGVKSATGDAENAVSQCPDDANTLCVAAALDAYADALRHLSPPLPPDLRSLPDIVSRAAHKVRQAKTKAQAVKAIKAAIAEVHKTISLLKADDPVVLKAETRDGGFVAEALEAADNKLEKAVGL
jgi:hypothetical protein